MIKKRKAKHGGLRVGAGRPLKYSSRTRMVGATIPKNLAIELDRSARDRGLNRSEAITQAIKLWLIGGAS